MCIYLLILDISVGIELLEVSCLLMEDVSVEQEQELDEPYRFQALLPADVDHMIFFCRYM